MYAWKTRIKPTKEIDFEGEIYPQGENSTLDYDCSSGEVGELAYWRKHPNLHGWMADLYFKKGGSAVSFNGVPVILNETDLQNLKAAVLAEELPPTRGFFFGDSFPEINPADLEFIEAAEEAIKEGYTVFYDSSW